ncbi:molybdopterin-dependent oxidoreductase [Herbiconiux sp.]|uniref:molybdopterin-dependent oxidoreductase n=1 Tax=Herbiconiux sp. TaxID=1871186 RepID=UPI0025BC61F3|nr:molybdopterin-dependent oxidoreductase [Herbiconiux sp.]
MRRLLNGMRRSLTSPVRNARSAVVIGRLLGLAFLVCFATGVYSHFLQDPLPWMRFATWPQLYQVTQGIHITAGIACFPLLLGKLYVVYPQLFQTPALKGPVHLLERASIALFVGASLVQIVIGLLNTYQWYPFPFNFKQVHWALSFVIIGSLAIHIAVKLPIIARNWSKAVPEADDEPPAESEVPTTGVTGRVMHWIDRTPAPEAGLSRRGFFAAVGLSTVAVVALTAGQSFAALKPLNLFGPRQKDIGPQGLPINRTAEAAKVTESAMAADWVLTVMAAGTVATFTRAQLLALPQTQVDLPIACVEGWSQMATWKGVRMRDLLEAAGAPSDKRLIVNSLEERGGYRTTEMGAEYVGDDLTLVALELNGGTLDIQHGYPARVIAPGRPGVLQTKWLRSLEVAS